MVILRIKHCLNCRHCEEPEGLRGNQRSIGLTLIEVLIALAIISIAMTAVIKATSQDVRANSYLQDKTIATWVGQQIINEIRVDLLVLPSGDNLKQKTTMLNRDWYWEATQDATPNKRIKKVEVNVFTHEDTDDVSPIVTLTGYTYAKE